MEGILWTEFILAPRSKPGHEEQVFSLAVAGIASYWIGHIMNEKAADCY